MTPMPPPKASTEGPRDRHVTYEIGQLVRALQAQGPQRPEDLGRLVGDEYWESEPVRQGPGARGQRRPDHPPGRREGRDRLTYGADVKVA